MSSVDFGKYMRSVAVELLGEPNKRLSSKDELRFGNNGSLAVDLKAGTWFDHEAGQGGGVLDLIGRQTGRLNGEAVDWLREQGFDVGDDRRAGGHAPRPEPEKPAPSPRAKIVATYDYVDESGDLLFQAVRLDPKDFRQRRRATPDDPPDKVKDGWVWSVKGVRQVPYHLPELIEAIALEHTVFVVEGEKDVHSLEKLGFAATTNAMGAGKWPESLNPFFAGADVVILPDNDPQATLKDGSLRFHDDGRPVHTGQDHGAAVAAALDGIARSVRILSLGGEPRSPEAGPHLPPKGDVSDWIEAGGTAEALIGLVDSHAKPWTGAPARLHFGSVWFSDADHALEEPEWLIDDLLTRGDMSLVYGPSKSGKSFLATHLSMAIARGEPVFDRKVRRGGVVYIAAEGRKGFKKRLKAYRIENGIKAGTDLPFLLVPAAVNLFAQAGDIDSLLADLRVIAPEMVSRFGVEIEEIVVDTYAAVSPGANENASEDVSRIVSNCKRFWEVAPHAHIMIVHHKNAAGSAPRGHTSLYAGIDNAIEVTCDEARNRSAKVDKMKDGEDGFSIGFRLQTVEIAVRDDGKPITSCVVVPASADFSRSGKGPGLSDQQKIALQALHEALDTHGEPAPSGLQLPYGVRIVRVEHWKREFLRRGFDEAPNESTFRMAFKRVGEALLAKRIIGRDQPYVWVVREPSV